jgi:hypothetical protein
MLFSAAVQPDVHLLQQQVSAAAALASAAGSVQLEPLLSCHNSSSSFIVDCSHSSSSLQVPRPLWCATAGLQQALIEIHAWASSKWWSSSSSSSAALSLSDMIRQRSMHISQQIVTAAAVSKQWQQQQLEASSVAQTSAVMA